MAGAVLIFMDQSILDDMEPASVVQLCTLLYVGNPFTVRFCITTYPDGKRVIKIDEVIEG